MAIEKVQDPGPVPCGRLLRWTGWIDDNGECARGFEVYPSEDWKQRWSPPCPDGDPVMVRQAVGYGERGPCELELRVALFGREGGVCQAIIDEHVDEIYVRVLVHWDDQRARRARGHDYVVPVRVWLEEPLGERAVIDVDSRLSLPQWTLSRPRS